MDVYSGPWPTLDHGPVDHAQYDGQVQVHLGAFQGQQRRSRSHETQWPESRTQEGEWQHLFDDLDAGNIPADFDMFGSATTSSFQQQQQQPLQSIEAYSTAQMHPNSTAQSNSSLLSYGGPNPHQQMWPSASAPMLGYPPPIPENSEWNPPPMYREPLNELHHFDQQHEQYPQHLDTTSAPFFGSPYSHADRIVEGMGDAWEQGGNMHCSLDSSGSDEINDLDASDQCYAQLLHRCLVGAPEHTMSLKELYEWVKAHSQKAKDPKNRGWQNSVRHNLSMNAAFERVPSSQSQGVKKGSLWRLTPSALTDGVISTTRYRKDPKRKPERRSSPALKRQISGAKGGQATRNATRRQQALREAKSFATTSAFQRHQRSYRDQGLGLFAPTPIHSSHASPQPGMMHMTAPSSPYFLNVDDSSLTPMSGLPTPPQVQLMYDMQPKPVLADFDFSAVDFTSGFVAEHDHFGPDTPSLATEASFTSDDGMQSLMSHNASREATSFPMDC